MGNTETKAKNMALHTAVECGNAELVDDLLKAGSDPNIQGSDGTTALMRAAQHADVECVRLLLAAKADTEIHTGPDAILKCQTALHMACRSDKDGCVEVVRLLLAAGAKPNAQEKWGVPVEVAEALIGAGADVRVAGRNGDTALHFACKDEAKKLAALRLLLEKGNGKAVINRPGGMWGFTPYARCIAAKSPEAARILIAHGAHANETNAGGSNSENDDNANGAGVNGASAGGSDSDSENDDFTMLRQLLTKAKLHADNHDNLTPLMRAASDGYKHAVEVMLNAGEDVNVTSPKDGDSALHRAVESGHDEIGLLLLSAGADYNALRCSADSAAHVAANNGAVRTLTAILDKGDVDIEAKGAAGSTLLTRAAQGGHADIVQLLLDRGADRDAADKDGYTALDLAAKSGHADCVKILSKN